MNMFRKIFKFFDRFEDHARHELTKIPLIYAFLAGTGVVIFWRGIWHLADDIGMSSIGSIFFALILMLSTGTFVSFFIGEQILLSGMREEKRTDEKTEEELKKEGLEIKSLFNEVKEIKSTLEEIKNKINK